jgi:exopolyphosphatase/guanosine-5'-triphosphate,3'-diphosphate pyrophosphatase
MPPVHELAVEAKPQARSTKMPLSAPPAMLAAIDLGSNSFRLELARIDGPRVEPVDRLREPVRLAGGLNREKRLDADSQARGLAALARFGERLRGLDARAVRAVGTNTLRVARNAQEFLKRGEAALGFPIEVIAGREEARLIWVGVTHMLPKSAEPRLVVDIGGGSTEFVVGHGFGEPHLTESLYMGCVGWSRRFFPEGELDRQSFRSAELAARRELQVIEKAVRKSGWREAVGSSGTARAISHALIAIGVSDGTITLEGMDALRGAMIDAGAVSALTLSGLKADRLQVLPGGLAIMAAIFRELAVETMLPVNGGLCDGLIHDQIARYGVANHHDRRETTVSHLMSLYQVDTAQAARVEQTALGLFAELQELAGDRYDALRLSLAHAARLHEIGLAIAHNGYHKHSAYIVEQGDMPGFTSMEQTLLASLMLGQTGKLPKMEGRFRDRAEWGVLLCLRLAVLMHRSRGDAAATPLRLQFTPKRFVLDIDRQLLDANPLTDYALGDELGEWKKVEIAVEIGPGDAGS